MSAETVYTKWNKWLSLLLAAAMLLSLLAVPPTANAKSSRTISMFVDSKQIISSVAPQMINGSVFVPLRQVTQTWKATVNWNSRTRQITLRKDGNTFVLNVNQRNATRNNRAITLSAPPTIVKNTTLVPVRFIGESFGAHVSWNAAKQKVSIFNYVDKLPVVGSYSNFKKLIAKQIEAQNRYNAYTRAGGFNRPLAMESTAAPSTGAMADSSGTSATKQASSSNSSGSGAGGDYSQTNTQVDGVDEADIVKNDGEFVYQVRKNVVTISRVYPSDQLEVVATIKNGSDANFVPTELYVDGDQLTVIGNSYQIMNVSNESATSTEKKIMPYVYYGDYYRNLVKAITYDISDKSNIKQVREFRLDGYYVSSRKIGSHLYLVANKYFNYFGVDRQDIAAPTYYDSAVSKEWQKVDFNDIRYFPDSNSQQFLLIAGVDLKNTDRAAFITTFLGSGEQVYASTDHLYVTFSKYDYKVDPLIESKKAAESNSTTTSSSSSTTSSGSSSDSASVESKPAVAASSPAIAVDALPVSIMPVIGRAWWWRPADVSTVIYKFSLEQGVVNFIARGSAPGTVLNQFSMDEHDGHFRVATTKTEYDEKNWRGIMSNHLYVLDKEMNVVGKIENIAPEERIYSVRYVGDRAYMVTFKTIDPLFVIDLSKPTAPKILGELKIPGYSNYLHPYDENHIIGFGKDTVEQSFNDPFSGTTNSVAYFTGMKMALFDVTDVNNPVEKFVEQIGDRGTDSELLYNHKALLFSKDKNLFALPITLMKMTDEKPAYAWQFGKFTWQGAYVYKLDLENGFQLQKQITHYTDEELKNAGNDWSYWYNDNNVKRILYIKDRLYTVSNNKIKANDLNTFDELSTLDLR